MSPADAVISKSNNIIQQPEDILIIIEVKMSVVWNWELRNKNKLARLNCATNLYAYFVAICVR